MSLRRRGKKWYVRCASHEGVEREVCAFTDRGLSLELEQRLLALVEARSMCMPPPAALLRWVQKTEPRIRERLIELDLVDRSCLALSQPIERLVERWSEHLGAKESTPRHVAQHVSRVTRALDKCGIGRWSALAPRPIESWLAAQRASGARFSAATSNHFVRALRGFTRWVVAEGLATEDPLASLRILRSAPTVIRRRALTPEEMRRLLATTAAGPTLLGMTGPERRSLYLLLLLSGLRAGEASRLLVADLSLGSTPPTLTVRAASAKARREQRVPVHPALAEELRRMTADRLPSARVLRAPPPARWLSMLRADLEAAKVDFETPAGRCDVHALRVCFISALGQAGASARVTMQLARHASPSMTLGAYSRAQATEEARALGSLPDIWSEPPPQLAAESAS